MDSEPLLLGHPRMPDAGAEVVRISVQSLSIIISPLQYSNDSA